MSTTTWPILPTQNAFIYAEAFRPGESLLSGTYQIHGPLDTDALREACDRLVRRHDALRTGIRRAEGSHDVARWQFWWQSYEQCVVDDATGIYEDLPFHASAPITTLAVDLAVPPLARISSAPGPDDTTWLVIAAHHVVCDQWSEQLLLRDLGQLYNEVVGNPSHLPEVAVQFPAYVDREFRAREAGGWSEPLRYWRGELESYEPASLPSIEDPQPGSAALQVSLAGDLGAAVERVTASRRGSTPFAVAASLFVGALVDVYRWTDVVLQVPIANRRTRDVLDSVGLFANLLQLRVRPTTDQADLLAECSKRIVGLLPHQHVFLNTVLESLGDDAAGRLRAAPRVGIRELRSGGWPAAEPRGFDLVSEPASPTASDVIGPAEVAHDYGLDVALFVDCWFEPGGCALRLTYRQDLVTSEDAHRLCASMVERVRRLADG